MPVKEHDLYMMLADYLGYEYKGAIWRFDLAADLKLTIGQARKHKHLQQHRGYPDLFIAEPRGKYHGLFLEVKRAGVKIYKRDGTLVSDAHIREQFDMLEQLRQRGYMAGFACGFDEAKKIIDSYLGGPAEEEVEL